MSFFTRSLVTEWIDAGKVWRVVDSFRFYSGSEGSNLFIEVPAGFETDLASIPGLVRWLVPKVGKDAQGAVVHDEAYRSGQMSVRVFIDGLEVVSRVTISRGMADSLYHQAMIALKVGRLRRKAIYYGLVAGGWVRWRALRSAGVGISTETTES